MTQATRPFLTALLLSCAALVACGGSGPAGDVSAAGEKPAGASGEVAGYIGSEAISLEEVERAAAGQLAELQQQRYDLLVDALERVASERLVNKEAATRGVSSQDLFRVEVEEKLTPPTEQEVQAFWQQVKDRVGGQTLQSLRPRIEQQLMNQKRQTRMQEFVAELKAKEGLKIVLDPPRQEVQVPAGEPSRGPEQAKVTVVEFSDFDCPFCRKAHPIVEQLLNEYGDRIRFVYRDFPLANHQRAVPAAEAARCAGEQGKYWEYFQTLMGGQGNLSDEALKKTASDKGLDLASFTACYESRRHQASVQTALEGGRQLGVTATPTFFINGRRLVGAPAYDQFKSIVEDELSRTSG